MKEGPVFCIILLLLLVFAVVIIAGCIGADYVPNRDIIVIKLNPDGTTAWVSQIDTGRDDAANDIIEVPGGGFVIAGQNTTERIGLPKARMVRLSSTGTVQWDRVLGNTYSELTKVISVPDGGYVTVSYDGEIWRIDPDGNPLWNRSTGIQGVWTVIRTEDSGYAIAGEQYGRIPYDSVVVYYDNGSVSSRPPYPNETRKIPGCSETSIQTGPNMTVTMTRCTVTYESVRQAVVMKLDTGGNSSWMRSYGAEGLDSAWSVIDASSGKGYLVTGYKSVPGSNVSMDNYLYAIQLDPNGTALNMTLLDKTEYFRSPQIRSVSDGFDILYTGTTLKDGSFNNYPVDAHLDLNGHVEKTRPVNSGVIITWTRDGGYFSAGFPVGGGVPGYTESIYGRGGSDTLHAMKLDSDGNLVWEHGIDDVRANYLKKVIQTADGGYAILVLKENQ
jgi:hypothetical protein